MLKKVVDELKIHYGSKLRPGPNDLRLKDALPIDIGASVELGDVLVGDLDLDRYGIGWWDAYPDLDLKTRILIGDYLIACARAISTNLLEAYCSRLEFDHALADFLAYLERGARKKKVVVPPPRGPYDDLAFYRVSTHFTGILRAYGSSLDCLAGCLVGVAALPTGIVRTDLRQATECLNKKHNNHQLLTTLITDLGRCEDDAGPSGWTDWLLAMRNTDVHRGRRLMTFDMLFGSHDEPEGVALQLPRSPEFTEVQAVIRAGGQTAAYFKESAEDLLTQLAKSVHSYIDGVCKLLLQLWEARRANPQVLVQPAAQWKDPGSLVSSSPVFSGYATASDASQVTEIGLAHETLRRLSAAALTLRGRDDLHPSPVVWH